LSINPSALIEGLDGQPEQTRCAVVVGRERWCVGFHIQ
jgi:hypothetical protein